MNTVRTSQPDTHCVRAQDRKKKAERCPSWPRNPYRTANIQHCMSVTCAPIPKKSLHPNTLSYTKPNRKNSWGVRLAELTSKGNGLCPPGKLASCQMCVSVSRQNIVDRVVLEYGSRVCHSELNNTFRT